MYLIERVGSAIFDGVAFGIVCLVFAALAVVYDGG